MHRALLFVSATFLLFACGTNRHVFTAPQLEQFRGSKTVAVLPFFVSQTGHRAKGITEESVQKANEELGIVFQESLYSFLLKHTGRKKKEPLGVFQSTQQTNGLLRKTGWTIQEMYTKTPEELAQLLGVDAVVMTTVSANKNISDGLATGLAIGQVVLATASQNTVLLPDINAADLNMNCSLYDKQNGTLLWKTFRQGSTNLPGNVNNLAEFYSNWIARRFPFRS